MKIKLFYVLGLMIVIGCKKDLPLSSVEFDVSTDQPFYYVGDEVTFSFTGTPEFISFYSGETGHDYDFIGGRVMSAELYMSFESRTVDGTQDDQFSVWASSDFSGNYTVEDVNAATWTNITDRFTLAAISDNGAFIPSGSISIADLLVDGQPLYIAYRYDQKPASIYGQRQAWRYRNFSLVGETEAVGSIEIATFASADWSIVQEGPWDSNRIVKEATQLIFNGNWTNPDVYITGWAISVPFYVASMVDLGPDTAIPIKALADTDRTTYTHIYSEPGIYTVTFVAANENLNAREEVIKQIELAIVPRD